MVGYNSDGPARDRVLTLMEQKDSIEREIRDHTAILERNNVGMQDPLVDQNGFPRNDIDVYQIRHARHRIICLQNDHKEIMKRIEQGLAEVHSGLRGSQGESSTTRSIPRFATHTSSRGNGHHGENGFPERESFAMIGTVEGGSPADIAGLMEGDEVILFGSIDHSNFVDLSQINQIVAHSVRQRIHVQVKREDDIVTLMVVPQPWAQPGLLGCQVRRKTS